MDGTGSSAEHEPDAGADADGTEDPLGVSVAGSGGDGGATGVGFAPTLTTGGGDLDAEAHAWDQRVTPQLEPGAASAAVGIGDPLQGDVGGFDANFGSAADDIDFFASAGGGGSGGDDSGADVPTGEQQAEPSAGLTTGDAVQGDIGGFDANFDSVADDADFFASRGGGSGGDEVGAEVHPAELRATSQAEPIAGAGAAVLGDPLQGDVGGFGADIGSAGEDVDFFASAGGGGSGGDDVNAEVRASMQTSLPQVEPSAGATNTTVSDPLQGDVGGFGADFGTAADDVDFFASHGGGGSGGSDAPIAGRPNAGHGGSGEPTSHWAFAGAVDPSEALTSDAADQVPAATIGESSTGGDATPVRTQSQRGGGSGGPMDADDFWGTSFPDPVNSSTGDMPVGAGESAMLPEDPGGGGDAVGDPTAGEIRDGAAAGAVDDPGSTPSVPNRGAAAPGRLGGDDPGSTSSAPPNASPPVGGSGSWEGPVFERGPQRLDDPGGTPSSFEAPPPASGATEDVPRPRGDGGTADSDDDFADFVVRGTDGAGDAQVDDPGGTGDDGHNDDPGGTPALEAPSPERDTTTSAFPAAGTSGFDADFGETAFAADFGETAFATGHVANPVTANTDAQEATVGAALPAATLPDVGGATSGGDFDEGDFLAAQNLSGDKGGRDDADVADSFGSCAGGESPVAGGPPQEAFLADFGDAAAAQSPASSSSGHGSGRGEVTAAVDDAFGKAEEELPTNVDAQEAAVGPGEEFAATFEEFSPRGVGMDAVASATSEKGAPGDVADACGSDDFGFADFSEPEEKAPPVLDEAAGMVLDEPVSVASASAGGDDFAEFLAEEGAPDPTRVIGGMGAVQQLAAAPDFGDGFADFSAPAASSEGSSRPVEVTERARDGGDSEPAAASASDSAAFADFGDSDIAAASASEGGAAFADSGDSPKGGAAFADFGDSPKGGAVFADFGDSPQGGAAFADFGDSPKAEVAGFADFGSDSLNADARAAGGDAGFADFDDAQPGEAQAPGGGADAAPFAASFDDAESAVTGSAAVAVEPRKADESGGSDDGFADFGAAEPVVDTAAKGGDRAAADLPHPVEDDGFADFSESAAVTEKQAGEVGRAGKAEDADSGFGDDFADFSAAVPTTASGASAGEPKAAAKAADEDAWGDGDDDFADFEEAPAGETPVPPPIVSAAGLEAPIAISGQRRASSPEELLRDMMALADEWCQRVKLTKDCANLFAALEASDELGEGSAGVVADGAADWDEWLQRDAGVPDPARSLLLRGAPVETPFPAVPFSAFGVSGDLEPSASAGSRMKEAFFAVLGKHVQLPAQRPAEGSPAGAAPCTATPVTASEAQAAKDAEADWGAFGFGAVSGGGHDGISGDGGLGGFGGDLLAQTMSDFGLVAAPPATSEGHMAAPYVAAAPAAAAFGADFDLFDSAGPAPVSVPLQPAAAPAAAGGDSAGGSTSALGGDGGNKRATEKVKRFLAGIPDLSHLYASSVAAS